MQLPRLGRPRPPKKLALRTALVAASTLALALSLTAPSADGALPGKRATPTDEPGVTASLWEWNWNSIKAECSVLADLGYDGVQVAPPQNSLKRTSGDAETPTIHPWWEVYQPVTYDLTSRMGNEEEFKAMVKTCRREGVKVYVDTVINHMTGQGNTSYGGQTWTPYNYPDVGYVPNDFHFNTGECSSSDGDIQDFNNKNQVFKCNLVGLEARRARRLPEQTARIRRVRLPGRRRQARRPGRPECDLLTAEQDQGWGQALLGA